ncbi:MAG: aminopeptidase N [Actinomycetota bacterium]|nr:aminopeptidase N [Actinomycetota bacterium]
MRILTRDEARQRAALLAVAGYTVSLDLTTGTRTFRSVSEIQFSCRTPGATTFAEIVAPAVRDVVLNGRRLDPAVVLVGDRLVLAELAEDNLLTVTADCAYSRTGEGLHRFVDPADDEVYLYSQTFLNDAARMFACFDQPDLKAPFTFRVTTPPDWVCISNSPAQQEAPGLWVFPPTPPLPTYLTAVHAGRYVGKTAEHRGIGLGVWCRRSLAEHLEPEELFRTTRAGFDYYLDVFGQPYAFGRYEQLFVPEFNAGAMENPGAVTLRDEYLFRARVTEQARWHRADVIAHELAHMWFGNLVSMRWWDDLWLNESFATYCSSTVLAAGTDYPEAWTSFCTGMKASGYRADQLPSTHPISADVPDTAAATLNFDGISYGKGAAVLRQLVAWVGEDAFWSGVRDYFAAHRFGNTELADLLLALQRASGRNLGRWSEAWLRSAGVNTVVAEVSTEDGSYREVVLRQLAPEAHPTLRPHRLRLGLYDAMEGRLHRRGLVDVDLDGPATPVPALNGEPAADLLLVNDDDLTFAKVRLDDASLRMALDGLERLPGTLARAVCWASVWDLTRDGVLPAREYVRVVLRAAPVESDIGLTEQVLTNLRTALHFYTDPAARAALTRQVAQRCRQAMRSAIAGSDHQLAYARTYIDTTTEAVALWDLLLGTAGPAGLAVDVDLRWRILGRLAALGAADADDIAAELATDPTATGRQRALHCRAAIPEPAAKASAWQALIEDGATELSNRELTAIATGFWQQDAAELGRPYVERYFAALPDLWRDRSPEIARQLTATLYPALLVEPRTLELTDDHLGQSNVDPRLRRLLGEQRAELARSLEARRRDALRPAGS